MDKTRLEALNVVYKHWFKEEILQKKEKIKQTFHSFIHNRESVIKYKRWMDCYWNNNPLPCIDPFWLKKIDFEPFGVCNGCKKNILLFRLSEFEECYQVWVECSNLNCRKIPIDSFLYLDKCLYDQELF